MNVLPNVTISGFSGLCGGIKWYLDKSKWCQIHTFIPNIGYKCNGYCIHRYQTWLLYMQPAVNTVYTVNGTTTTSCSEYSYRERGVYRRFRLLTQPTLRCCPDRNAVQLCITSSLAPSPFTSYSSGSDQRSSTDNTPAGGNHTINVPYLHRSDHQYKGDR